MGINKWPKKVAKNTTKIWPRPTSKPMRQRMVNVASCAGRDNYHAHRGTKLKRPKPKNNWRNRLLPNHFLLQCLPCLEITEPMEDMIEFTSSPMNLPKLLEKRGQSKATPDASLGL